MGFFSNTKINIIKKVPDGIVIAVTGAKAALKCEITSTDAQEIDTTIPMVMTLNGTPLMEMHPSYCPTCCGLLATGYGLDNAKCTELTEISDNINSGFTGVDDFIETIKTLIGLFEDGVYLIKDTKTFPVDGDGHFFWAIPDELTYYNAYTDAYYITDLMQLIELKGAFLYPTQSRDRYDDNRVKYYMNLFSSGTEKPRAIAYNALRGMSALLDGHHKACAAARLHAPLDTIVITKGHLAGDKDNFQIRFGYYLDAEYDIAVDKTSGLPSKLYKQYTEQMADVYAKKKRQPPVLYKGLPVECKFTKREWEKCYTDAVYYYPTADQFAGELACDYSAIENMSPEDIYYYVFQQEDPVYYAKILMSSFVRTNDKRTKELLMKFARHNSFSGDTKQIIAAALRGLMNFKDDETEKIFIDFVVCGDDYLADIAKDYWEDVE
ncbi:hypothetical protein [Ruminococcus sp.]|uniref:hypothetical protein n=1 Tax=Ruminococcus sp. TaxID=41978 RepID=UPI0025D88FD9|nr:hypothetical protein [Ruminococcus sp.]